MGGKRERERERGGGGGDALPNIQHVHLCLVKELHHQLSPPSQH